MQDERQLSQHDAVVLGDLAETLMRVRDVKFNPGDRLAAIIASAIIHPGDAVPDHCVGLGSEVTYREVGSLETATIVLVVPDQASQALGRVSVLAPIALALVGRKVDSIVEVELPFGQVKFVQIVSVRQIFDAGDGALETGLPAYAIAGEPARRYHPG